MLMIYGTRQCPDTLACLADLEAARIPFEFRDITLLPVLKEFMQLRDSNPIFAPVRAAGGVGIPLLVMDDGSLSFEWSPLL